MWFSSTTPHSTHFKQVECHFASTTSNTNLSMILNLHPAHKIGDVWWWCVDDDVVVHPRDDVWSPSKSPVLGWIALWYGLILSEGTIDEGALELFPEATDAVICSMFPLVDIMGPQEWLANVSGNGIGHCEGAWELGAGGEEHPGGNGGDFENIVEEGIKFELLSGGVPPLATN